MGGTKKRKREESLPDEDEQEIEDDSLQTPIPHVRNANKRKSSETYDEFNSKKFKGKNKKQKPKRFPNRDKTNKPRRQNTQNNDNNPTDEQPFEGEGFSGNPENQPFSNAFQKLFQKKRRNRNRNKKQNQNQNSEDTGQKHETFRPFDYSSVDFNQFQGGAAESKAQKFFKSKYKPKVK